MKQSNQREYERNRKWRVYLYLSVSLSVVFSSISNLNENCYWYPLPLQYCTLVYFSVFFFLKRVFEYRKSGGAGEGEEEIKQKKPKKKTTQQQNRDR